MNDGFDLQEILGRDGSLVREIESEFGRGDEGSFLVDVVAEDVSESEVEDVSGGVVLSDGGSSELGAAKGEKEERGTESASRDATNEQEREEVLERE